MPGPLVEQPTDLVARQRVATRPKRRRVADLTYVTTLRGIVDVVFVIDVPSWRIFGWRVAISLRRNLALDAWSIRCPVPRPIGASSITAATAPVSVDWVRRATGRGRDRGVGRQRGDSDDNALAESVIGLFNTDVIHRGGLWT